ncbi:MAG: hypothetical protein KKA67_05080 [Spirochaetes bacterium]|nr:hypothetical protein [Spirochaetota bacterium]MBU1080849.1 hypothetical protein [Spirochaetota bacterium]
MSTAIRNAAISLSVALIVASTAPCHAQSYRPAAGDPAWLSLERGKRAYADKDFGSAVVHFDEAISARRESFTTAASRLDQSLQSKPAKSGGDSVKAVLAAFASEDFIQRDYDRLAAGRAPGSRPLLEALRKERISDSHRAFLDVLLLVYEYSPAAGLGDSIADLSSRVRLLAKYPEAEYWKGRVFFVEGELPLAELQYKRAFGMRDSLEIPGEAYTILYSMAELYGARSDYVAWENVLLEIVEGTDVDIDPYLRSAMMATLQEDGFDRFMTLYRIEPAYSLDANSSLARFYLERGRAMAAEHAAIAVSMCLTRAIALLGARDKDYSWKGLDDFMARAAARRDVSSYLAEVELPGLLVTLADALYVSGSRIAAASLWRAVARSGVEPYAAVATARVANPGSSVRRAAP